jgi:hypothetical protein
MKLLIKPKIQRNGKKKCKNITTKTIPKLKETKPNSLHNATRVPKVGGL